MTWSSNKNKAALLTAICAVTPLSCAFAQPIIKFGTAAQNGSKTITLILPGGGTEKVNVPDIEANEDPTEKVINALKGSKCCKGSDIDAAGRVEVEGATALSITSNTGEQDRLLASPEPLRDPAQAVLAYGGSLQGVNAEGDPAVYSALISLNGRTSDVTVPFGDLPTPTAAGALAALYASLRADLEPADRTRLTLVNNSILFDFLAGTSDASASIFTTDVGMSSTVGIEAVPEPSSVALLGVGLLGVALAYRRRACPHKRYIRAFRLKAARGQY